jgi:hypothetical protein
MLRDKQPSTSRFSVVAYSLGLAIIFSATILNFCLHKLPPKHLYSLPSFIVEPYEQGGNLGVTLTLAGFGLFLMVLGYISTLTSGGTTRTGGHTAVDSACAPDYSDPRITVTTAAGSSSGTMVLETGKYLGKKPSALPGATVIGDKQ